MKKLNRILVVLVLLVFLVSIAPAASAAKNAGYVQTTVNLALRSGTSTDSTKLASIPRGTKVAYSTTKTVNKIVWYKVQYNKKTGWVMGTYVKKVTNSSSTSSTQTSSKYITVKDGSRSMKIYPATKINWFTGGIASMLKKGSTFQVYDVKSKRIWTAYRQGGGNHMDIEPATAADTRILCSIYGVSSAAEITAKNLWQRRPCLVTVNGHTYACSLYGIPHGQSTIDNNNMNGQVCLHFTGSKTHSSKKVDAYHQAAIEYAWKHAPNGYQ